MRGSPNCPVSAAALFGGHAEATADTSRGLSEPSLVVSAQPPGLKPLPTRAVSLGGTLPSAVPEPPPRRFCNGAASGPLRRPSAGKTQGPAPSTARTGAAGSHRPIHSKPTGGHASTASHRSLSPPTHGAPGSGCRARPARKARRRPRGSPEPAPPSPEESATHPSLHTVALARDRRRLPRLPLGTLGLSFPPVPETPALSARHRGPSVLRNHPSDVPRHRTLCSGGTVKKPSLRIHFRRICSDAGSGSPMPRAALASSVRRRRCDASAQTCCLLPGRSLLGCGYRGNRRLQRAYDPGRLLRFQLCFM